MNVPSAETGIGGISLMLTQEVRYLKTLTEIWPPPEAGMSCVISFGQSRLLLKTLYGSKVSSELHQGLGGLLLIESKQHTTITSSYCQLFLCYPSALSSLW